jgi:ubiquinone/menaquinone biosynthesis C-methylase UbiE
LVPLFPRIQGATERMDAPDADPAALEAALHQVARVNRILGARRALVRHLPWALPGREARILDVGTGSADLPLAMADWASRQGRRVRVTAVDAHPLTLEVARRQTASAPDVRIVGGDGIQLPFPDASFDLAVLSMTLHHMEGADVVGIVRELARVARGGKVLVAELERSVLHYLGARALAATVWRNDPITRHDGPLSVRRSFTPRELRSIAVEAGLRHPRVHRHPVFRLVLRAHA